MTTPKRPTSQQTTGGEIPAGDVATAAAVLEAQKRLEELRRAAGIADRPKSADSFVSHGTQTAAAALRPRFSPVQQAQRALEARRVELGLSYRRPGLDQSTKERMTEAGGAENVGAQTKSGAGLDQGDQLGGRVATVYPTLAAAFMASKSAAAGRLWVLLRAWDDHGRGFYDLDQVYQAFAVEGSPWHIGTRRRIQQLLKEGAGLFWTLRGRKGGRYHSLQLHGVATVAAAFKVGRLAGSPVKVPVADLLGGMHRVRAALYSAVLTLRDGGKGPRPVTRQTLARMTGAAASTQRTYTRTAGIEARPNFVILDTGGDVEARPNFIYRHNKLARRMANSYTVPSEPAGVGRQRKINRALNLVITEARGYRPENDFTRLYHTTAGQAARAYGRDYHHDHYWPKGKTAAGGRLWNMLEAVTL